MLPQARARFYIIAISLLSPEFVDNAYESVDKLIGVIMDTLHSVELPAESVESFKLDDNDPLVISELNRLQKAKLESSSKKRPKTAAGEAWLRDHEEHFKAQGLRWGAVEIPSHLKDSEWFNVLSPREQDCVLLTSLDTSVRYLDVSQGIKRLRTRSDEFLATICPSQKVWDVQRSRLLIGHELLSLQAVPCLAACSRTRACVPERGLLLQRKLPTK